MTSIGRVRSAGPVAEDDELSGVGQCAGRGTLREGRSLAELEPTPPLAGDRPPGHRTALTKGEGLPPPSHASGRIEARTEDRHDDVEEAGRVSHREPWRVSTKNGLDSLNEQHGVVGPQRRYCTGRCRALASRNRRASSDAPVDRPAGAAVSPLYTVNETAEVLRTTGEGVYSMIARGQLPGVTRIGRRVLIRRDDLLGWFDERRAPSPEGDRR